MACDINTICMKPILPEITRVRIRFWTYIVQVDNQNAIFRIYLEDIIPIIISGQQKCFLYLDYFLMTKSLPRAKHRFCHQKLI
jgi:hypothetical protein